MEPLKLIPQLFHDVIARVIPGSIAITMVAAATDLKLGKLVTDFWAGAGAIQQSALLLAFGFIVAAYVVGQIMSPISDFVEHKIVQELFRSYFQVVKDAISAHSKYPPPLVAFLLKELGCEKKDDSDRVTAEQASKAVFVWYDWLRVNDPDAGARAAKIRAEYRMHSQDAVAFVMSLVIHLASVSMQLCALKPVLIAVLAIAGSASLWATARTHRFFQWAVVQQFYAAKASSVNAKRGEP